MSRLYRAYALLSTAFASGWLLGLTHHLLTRR